MMTATEKQSATQIYRVFIKATPQAVWDAITRPEWSEKYGYGGKVEYELRPGGAYRHLVSAEMKTQGMPDVLVVGEVIESDPPRKLVQTWHPIWDPTAQAEAATHLTWEIEPQPRGFTRLTLTHDVSGAPSIAKMVSGENEQAGGGWNWVLSDLKTLLETGQPLAG